MAYVHYSGTENDADVVKALDNGAFYGTYLTAQDLRNARTIFVKCPACIEGKLYASSAKTSTSSIACHIGEHLHVDIIPLRFKSVEGKTFILFAGDVKAGCETSVP